MSSKLFRFIAALIVIMLIAGGLYKSLLGRNSEPWEQVGFDSLQASMQEDLVQMHWQWQYDGRPSSIEYEMTLSQRNKRVEMNAKGWPAIAPSKKACSEFLSLFAGDVIAEVSGLALEVNVQQQLNIQVEFLSRQGTNDFGEVVDICRYSRESQQFEYQLGTGNLF